MSFEVNLNDRTANVELLNRKGNKVKIAVDGKKYDVDIG
jgi:hypothetical protein